jgi:hypothetical protein
MRRFFLNLAGAFCLGVAFLSTASVQAYEPPAQVCYQYRWVVTWEARRVPYTIWETYYDCGRAYRVEKIRYRIVLVAVKKRVLVSA